MSAVTGLHPLHGTGRAPEGRKEERAKIERFRSCLQILPCDPEYARIAGEINAGLLNRGAPVSTTEVRIGATSLPHGSVVTSKRPNFIRINGSKLAVNHRLRPGRSPGDVTFCPQFCHYVDALL